MTVLYMFLFGLVKGSSVSDVAVLHRLFLFGLGRIKKDDAFPLSLQFLFLNRFPFPVSSIKTHTLDCEPKESFVSMHRSSCLAL